MSKREEYKNPPATDAPHQKPGTAKQANATNIHTSEAILGNQPASRESITETKRKGHSDSHGPQRVGDTELP